ncbi:hypothetical protein RRG08_066725 [Elysia crispata]|uniref:Uncharacterized protein n=1 Tax=Elysia crispata TaxID=231223 RepID=A0AAE1B916_9GAST|nr:hypothetical protein RRG08_066725 [Elysia crispata]
MLCPLCSGPGAYGSQRQTAKGGLMITKDKRFKQDMDDFPGPGTYEVSAGHGTGQGGRGGLPVMGESIKGL